MHLRAAAAITPSGVPPTPSRMSAPDSDQAVAMAPATSPSEISRMRAPVRAHLLDQLGVAGPVEDHRGHVPNRLALGLGDGPDVVASATARG